MRPFKSIAHMAINHPTLGPPIPDSGGAFLCVVNGVKLTVIASWDADSGWDHVSVTVMGRDRCPRWDEMEAVKRRFFLPDEAAYQLHVPVSDHINTHSGVPAHMAAPQRSNSPSPGRVRLSLDPPRPITLRPWQVRAALDDRLT